MAIKEWTTLYPGDLDSTTQMPDLVDNEDVALASQWHALRDAMLALQQLMGSDGVETGSIRFRVDQLEDGYSFVISVLSNAGGDLEGSYPDPTVVKLQGLAVSSATPTDGYSLTWNAGSSQWESSKPVPGGVAGGDLSGTYPDPRVIKLQARNVSGAAPNISEVLTWDGSQWTPAPAGSPGAHALGGPSHVADTLANLNAKVSDADLISTITVAGGDLVGIYPNPTVSRIEGYDVSPLQPTDGYALTWDDLSSRWESSKPVPGGAAGGDLSGTYPRPTVAKMQNRSISSAAPLDGYALMWNAALSQWEPRIVSTADEKVKISATDNTPAFLDTKLVAGSYIELTQLNPGSNEQLRIDFSGNTDGYNVKVSATDTVPGFLQQKLVQSTNISLTQNSPGGNETLSIATTPVLKLDEQSSNPSPFANDGYLFSKDVDGYTELFYLDNYGTATQITSDGYLDTLNSLRGVGMYAQTTDPIYAADKGIAYTKEADGITELFYRDSDGDILQISKAGRFNLPDGYISFRYDELSPGGTTGSETSMTLGGVPVDGYALHVFRNGMMMRPVDVLSGTEKQEFTLSGDQVQFTASGEAGNWYSAFYIDGYMLVGAGGSVKQNVVMANNQSTDSDSDVVVGAFPIAAGDYPSRTIKFLATASVTGGGLTGHVKLYNVTDSALVSDHTFTGVSTAKQISSALILPSAEKMYEIRISVSGGAGPSDRILCMWAGLQIG